MSRDLKAIEGREFTLRAQKNSQDSVRITDEAALPVAFRRIDARIGGVLWETVLANLPDELGKMLESTVEESRPDTDSIKAAILARGTGSRGRAATRMALENQVAATQSLRISCSQGRRPRRSHSRQPREQKGPVSQAPFALAAFFLVEVASRGCFRSITRSLSNPWR